MDIVFGKVAHDTNLYIILFLLKSFLSDLLKIILCFGKACKISLSPADDGQTINKR